MELLRGVAAALGRLGGRRFEDASPDLRARVAEIVARVRAGGDVALRELGARYDGIDLEDPALPDDDRSRAAAQVDAALAAAIDEAIARVRAFHERQARAEGGSSDEGPDGTLGQIVLPMERVACYVPSGAATLFSTLVMTAVPAQVAGVRDVVVATPPRHDGTVAPAIAYTAERLGIDRVYRMGGAQAVAALAYGTGRIPRVDAIVGPGSPWVVIAKQLVFGQVAIEALPGPTETMVVADAGADPAAVAADLLAQAEHDGAQSVLVATDEGLVHAVRVELERQLADLPTAPTARANLSARGVLVLVDDLEEAMEVANAYAPEHLCLAVADPRALLPAVRHAGGVFLGHVSMEALGDYVAGPSHVMPTSGTARFSSALNVRHFQRVVPVVDLSARAVLRLGPAAARMARAEGLEAHARAIDLRLGER